MGITSGVSEAGSTAGPRSVRGTPLHRCAAQQALAADEGADEHGGRGEHSLAPSRLKRRPLDVRMPSNPIQRFASLRFTTIAVLAFLLAGALTAFYFVHERLPIVLRAPTSILLAPIAIVDGACYHAGIPGIYGKVLPMFFSMFSVTLAMLAVASKLSRRESK